MKNKCFHSGYEMPVGLVNQCNRPATFLVVGKKHYGKMADAKLKSCARHINSAIGNLRLSGYAEIDFFNLKET